MYVCLPYYGLVLVGCLLNIYLFLFIPLIHVSLFITIKVQVTRLYCIENEEWGALWPGPFRAPLKSNLWPTYCIALK